METTPVFCNKRKDYKWFGFYFEPYYKRVCHEGVKRFDVSKVSQENDIPAKIIKENADIFFNFKYQSFSNIIVVCIFPTSLKLANMMPVFKKRAKNSKENYRSVSILPNI